MRYFKYSIFGLNVNIFGEVLTCWRRIPIVVEKYGKSAYEFRENVILVTIPFRWVREFDSENAPDEVKKYIINPSSTAQVDSLVLVLNGEMSNSQLMNELNHKDRVSFRENYIQKALELSFIEMTQPDLPKSPTQKYRLTQKGLDYKEMLLRKN